MFIIKPFGDVLFIAVHGRSSLEGSVVLVVVWTVFFFFRIFDVKNSKTVKEKLWFCFGKNWVLL